MHRQLLAELIHVAHTSGSESEKARLLHAAFREIVAAGVAAGELSSRQGVDTATLVVQPLPEAGSE